MAKNPKPVKIKRYKRNSASPKTVVFKKVLTVAAGVVLLIAAGFLLGKPVVNFFAGLDFSAPSEQTSSQQQPDSSDGQRSQSGSEPVQVSDTSIYYYADISQMTTEGGIDSVIAAAKTAGADHCVFDLKDASGYIHYNSENQYAQKLKADTVADLDMVVKKMNENGITPVARVYTFMDRMISSVERGAAVKYQGTESLWLDTSAALGGKSWANPASSIMQSYITDITDEILSKGIKEIIYAGYSTPTGYSLDKRDFGASTEQVLANMKNLLNTLKSKASAKGGRAIWQFEYSATASGGDYAQYIVHPFQLGAENVIITADASQVSDISAVESLKKIARDNGITHFALWMTDGTTLENIQSAGSYFVR